MRSRRRSLRLVSVSLAFLAPTLAVTGAFAQPTTSTPGATAAPGDTSATSTPTQGQASAEPAGAKPSDVDLKEARVRYDRGLELYKEGEFALAVIEFERAYALVPDYRVLYNIGQVRIQLAQYARARRVLEQYLAEGGDRIAEDRKKSVQADLEMLAMRTGTLEVETNVEGADILVNDVLVGRSPLGEPLLLDAGEHRVQVRKAGYAAHLEQITLAGRDSKKLTVELEKLPEANVSPIIVEKQVITQKSNRETWMWATWSATGAFAAGAGITGFFGIKAAKDLDELRKSTTTRGALDSQQRRARTLLTISDVLGAAAVLSGAAALYVTFSGSDEEAPNEGTPPPARVGFTITPSFVGLEGTYF